MRASLLLLVTALCGSSLACSAIVTPDPSRLGGRDAGPPGVDAFRPMTGCAAGCDDGVSCTRDSCVSDVCQHVPDDTLCGAMQRCAASGCVATSCAGPADCNDGNDCTVDRCMAGTCMPIARDADMDAHGDAACGGDDCNDANPAVAPGRPETCGNGLDDDCNPGTSDTCTMGMLPDRCETAEVVDLSSGSAVVRGDFGMLATDYDSFCIEGGGRGPDAVYRLELGTRVTDLRIETVGDVDTVLSVSGECGSFGLPACNDDQRPGADTNARVWLHPAAGTIYVLVSSFDRMGGPYEVHFTTSPLAANECGDGSLDVTEGGTVVAVPIPPSRVTGTCMPDGTSRAIESTMRFEGGSIDRLRLYAGYQAYLHARSFCDLDGEEFCETGSPLGTGSFIDTNARTGAERLHLFVDGGTRMDQGFALFVEP